MVNEQIGTENLKRRVDLENRRQRMLSKIKTAMWADHAECQRMGYDWMARRAKWEAQLKELQALRGDHSAPRVPPTQTPKPLVWSDQGWRGHTTDKKLRNDDLYAQAMSRLDQLEEEQVPAGDSESGEDQEAVFDWFKVRHT